MGKRPSFHRGPDDAKSATLAFWDVPPAQRRAIAERVRYRASGLHKRHPSSSGAWTVAHKADKSKCGTFPESSFTQFEELLRQAIEAGCVSQEFRGEFPSRVWVFINRKLHEARLSNNGLGEYHGFPLEYPEHFPQDPQGLLKQLTPHATIPAN